MEHLHPVTGSNETSRAPEALRLRVDGLTMRFDSVLALDGASVGIAPGEIHALMGENGAGKSTLIKLLAGVYQPTAGRMELDGRPFAPASPREAEARGVSIVHQEVPLIGDLSVAENLTIGREPMRFMRIDWKLARKRAAAALARIGITVDVSLRLASCSLATRQLVAIARALDVSPRVLILDEPTSSLDSTEVEALFATLRRVRDAGVSVILVTHFLDQVYAVADRITVLRDGRAVGTRPVHALSRRELVHMMIGREEKPEPSVRPSDPTAGAPDQVPRLRATGLGRTGSVSGIDIQIGRGEAVGLAGLLGSGRTEVARLLFGADRADAGSVALDGTPVQLRSPRDAIAHGIAMTPEDRRLEGLIPNLSVRENIVLALQARRGALRPLTRRERRELADRFIAALRIKTPSAETPIVRLSGGNQQKALLARWLATSPRLLILDEPTRGIDVGARAEIHRLISQLRADGMAILLVSSDLDELVAACVRLVVLRDRRQVGELGGQGISVKAVMDTVAGHGT